MATGRREGQCAQAAAGRGGAVAVPIVTEVGGKMLIVTPRLTPPRHQISEPTLCLNAIGDDPRVAGGNEPCVALAVAERN
jgi:hypothetical protein